MDLFAIDQKFGIKEVSDQQAGAQTNTVLLAAANYRDQADTLAVNPDSEYIVVGVEFSASTTINFYLQNADGAGGRKGITFYVAANSGSLEKTWIPMGKGKPIKYTSSGGILSLRVLYIVKRYSEKKPA